MHNKEGELGFFSKKNNKDENEKSFFNYNFSLKNRKGQVTIFIIIAIIIVAAVVIFFAVRGNLTVQTIPASIQPVYNSFLSCVEDKTKVGIDVLESQGGYITLPQFEPGNAFMPFSSELNFLGNPIPYWYYVSGNNFAKEQVPSQSDMEKSLANFIDTKIRECDYQNYYSQGFEITQDVPTAIVTINNNNVAVNLKMNLKISYGNDTSLIQNHKVSVNSNLGQLYSSAKTVYNKEQKELFLENFGIDVMRLYAPVDGVDLSCSPETWNAEDIFNNLKDAIETNTLALNTQTPSTTSEKYFSISGINADVRFINSKNWTGNSFEVNPADSQLMIANPVGNQQGLGVLGFCYVPYHFVYNIKYPVLVQVFNGDEVFQFPIAVIIQGNEPRTALNSTASTATSDLCPYKNTLTTVNTHDNNLNPVDTQISYECFGESCYIGSTSSGILSTQFPQCVNGFVIARADGYKESRQQYSTTQEGNVDISLDKLYPLNLNLKLGGADYNGKAIVYFDSEGNSQAISYPEQKNVQLSEGNYNISVYVYQNSSIQFQATTQQECTQVPDSGIGGIFGITEKKCFDVNIPSQLISSVLAGGGKQTYSVSEDSLKNSQTIEINADALTIPTTIQQLQDNYVAFDGSGLEVNLK